MEQFINRHKDSIDHILSFFDRILFRGTLRSISHVEGMNKFLTANKVFLKDFKDFVLKQSTCIKQHAEQIAQQQNRPFIYIPSPSISKEEIARHIMERDNITSGLICVLSCVELCISYAIRKDRQEKKLKLIPAERKCLHFYFYLIDREFGFMHVRLQSWFPCPMQVWINGREWLARKMDKYKISYQRSENCFIQIQNSKKAQGIADSMLICNWQKVLQHFEQQFNPLLQETSKLNLHGYYWTIRQAEYATDVVFKNIASLAAIYPNLINHAIKNFSCENIMRFLGRNCNSRFSGEVITDLNKRSEGIRINHRVEENSIKMYDKKSCILRIETTINNPRRFKVYRKTIRKGQHVSAWIPMRKGVADIYRRMEISRAANARYLDALSVVGDDSPSHQLLDTVCAPIYQNDRRYRALHPIAPQEANLFKAVLHGEFFIRGFCNTDICNLLYPELKTESEKHKAKNRVTRLIRLLRAHKLIQKVPKSHLYRVTFKGNLVMSTALIFRESDISLLAKAA